MLAATLQEDNTTETFNIDTLKRIAIDKNINFGYNWLEAPEDSFPQMVINYIKFDGQAGILCFYLSTNNDEHFLKPFIILFDKEQIRFNSYAIITGNTVREITDVYFKMREPFEKEKLKLESPFTTIEEVDKDFDDLFNPKE